MQKAIPMAKDAYMNAVSVSMYEKHFNIVADAINKAVENGELCCEVFLSSLMDKKVHNILDRMGYSIYPIVIERADSSLPSIYTISWTAEEIKRNK